jgi:putative transposase
VGINRKNIYYQSKLEQKDQELRGKILKVHKKDSAYGHRRVADKLGINHKRAARVMKKYGIKPPRRSRSKKYTTRSTSNHSYTNIMKDIKIKRVNQAWVSDLTYIKYQKRFIYLATVLDVHTREILAARISSNHDANLALATTQAAVAKERANPQIFHTDQGREFMAEKCTKYLEDLGTKISVSDTASPWQNGYQESFFSRFKAEMGDMQRFETLGELSEEIYSYINYYNTERIHTALKMPPKTFRLLS